MPALGRALLDALRDHGARESFGVPGAYAGRVPVIVISGAPGVHRAAARFGRRQGGGHAHPAAQPGAARGAEGSDALLLLGVVLSDANFALSGRRIDMRRRAAKPRTRRPASLPVSRRPASGRRLLGRQ